MSIPLSRTKGPGPVRRASACVWALTLSTLAVPVAARAELAVLADGRTIRVASWDVGDERTKLVLPGGGVVEISSDRLERIVDDEIPLVVVPPPPAAPLQAAVELPAAPAKFDLRWKAGAKVLFPSDFDAWIVSLGAKHDVDPALISAVVKAESDFSPWARSPKGAVGLMQLMPATAARLGIENRFDPVSSLEGGIRYLRWLADRYSGDVSRVLAAYNAGEGAVDRWGGIPPYRETKNYVKKILGYLSLPGSAPAPGV